MFSGFRRVSFALPPNIKLDAAQTRIMRILNAVRKGINASFFMKFFYHQRYKGIYLYGPVGTGKSLIVKAFFDSVSMPKKWYHYQALLKFLHEESHKMFVEKKMDALETIAEKMACSYSMIVVDEIEIRDITDAMIIQRISEILLNKGCFICFTSNIKPSDLYMNGLQRELFMKFIKKLETEFLCYHLDNGEDYRFSKASYNKKMIIEDSSSDAKESFEEIVTALAPGKIFQPKKLEIFGREIVLRNSFKKVIYMTIEDICDQEASYNDFITIASFYNAAIIDGSGTSAIEESDKIIRFINFIDSLYENKLLVVALFNTKVKLLYKGKKYQKEFGRAISRIAEMSSSGYISTSKYFSGV